MQAISVPQDFHSPEIQDEMKPEDRKWVSAEVARQIEIAKDAFRPHGWRRVTNFLREWGLAGTAITAPIALLALAGAGWYYAFSRVDKTARFEADTSSRLGNIDKDIKTINDSLTSLKITQAAQNPSTPQSSQAVHRILADAKDNQRLIDPAVLSDVGEKFVNASAYAPQAWDAALQLMTYKSFQLSITKSYPKLSGSFEATQIMALVPPNEKPPEFHAYGEAPLASAAEFFPIGQNPNQHSVNGHGMYLALGGGVSIDGQQLQHVVFIGTHISYTGQPTKLTDVYFVNCTFEMPVEANTRNLALAVLNTSPTTTFSAAHS